MRYKWSVISFSIHAAHPLPPGGLVVRIISTTPKPTPRASQPIEPDAPLGRGRCGKKIRLKVVKIEPAPGEIDVFGNIGGRSENEELKISPIAIVEGPQGRGAEPKLSCPGQA